MKMNKGKSMIAAAVFSAALALCAQTPAPAPAAAAPAPAQKKITAAELFAFLPDTVAEMNGVKLTKAEMIKRFEEMKFPAEQIAKMPHYQAQLKQMAEGLMLEKAILGKAAAAGFKPDAAAMKKDIVTKFNALPKEQQAMVLQQSQKKDINELADELSKNQAQLNNYALNAYFESLFNAAKAKVTDADVQKFYNDNKEKDFKTPETVTVSHILVLANGVDKTGKKLSDADALKQDADAKKKIEEIKAKLDKGEDFGKLAEEFSECPSGKQSKGALPPFSKGQMVPEFEKAAFALQKPGELSPVVKTTFGYHIIKFTKKTDAGYVPFNDGVKNEIKQHLAGTSLNIQLRAEMENLKKSIKTFGFPEAPAPAPAPAAAPAPAPAAK